MAIAQQQPQKSATSMTAIALPLVFDGEGTQLSRYLHGPQVDQILAEETADGDDVRWALSDHQGSVRDVVDSEGTVLNHLTYDSYGQVTSETTPDVDFRFGYTGRERDEETGLYYYRARYFDPAVGTFVSEDPLGFEAGDRNVYRYVFNSPTNYTDPSGLLTIYNGNPIRDALRLADPFGRITNLLPEPIRNFNINLSVNAGEGFGENAQQYWVERYIDERNPWYERAGAGAAGLVASLWTCDTSDATFATLSTAWGVARPAANTNIESIQRNSREVVNRGGTLWDDASWRLNRNRNASPDITNPIDVSDLIPGDTAASPVIGRLRDIRQPANFNYGEISLRLQPNYSWNRNKEVLQSVIDEGKPIRDLSPDSVGGILDRERAVLRRNGWGFDSGSGYWLPPNWL